MRSAALHADSTTCMHIMYPRPTLPCRTSKPYPVHRLWKLLLPCMGYVRVTGCIGAAWDRGELPSVSELKSCSKRCILREATRDEMLPIPVCKATYGAGGCSDGVRGLDGGVLGAHHVASCGKPQEMRCGLFPCVKPHMAQVAAAAACVGWMAVSSGLIMLNKHLMSTDGFHFPMALSCLGMLFSSVASHFCCRVQPIWSLCYLLVSPTFPPCVFRMAAWCIVLRKESIPPGAISICPLSLILPCGI